MQKSIAFQNALFPDLIARFPSTRYQGSKAKLAPWIWEQIADLDFTTCLDAFGGTGAVAYQLKEGGKKYWQWRDRVNRRGKRKRK